MSVLFYGKKRIRREKDLCASSYSIWIILACIFDFKNRRFYFMRQRCFWQKNAAVFWTKYHFWWFLSTYFTEVDNIKFRTRNENLIKTWRAEKRLYQICVSWCKQQEVRSNWLLWLNALSWKKKFAWTFPVSDSFLVSWETHLGNRSSKRSVNVTKSLNLLAKMLNKTQRWSHVYSEL